MSQANKSAGQSNTQKMLKKKSIQQIVKPVSHTHMGNTAVYRLRVLDGYHGPQYKIERFATRLVGSTLESYLAKRPHLDFNHPGNKAKKVLYTLPALKQWSVLMPGALALEPIHHPKVKRLPTGHRMDPLTSRIFRHGLDTVGVRTRTLTAGWIAHDYSAERPGQPINWVSLAGGTAAPTMLMVQAAGINPQTMRYTNIDQDSWAIDVSKEITAYEGIQPGNTQLITGDIFDTNSLHSAVMPGTADVIDLMGIFEYLDAHDSVRLLQLAYGLLKPRGIVIACNMRTDHPQLNLHKRGVGWPYVIQKSTDDLIGLCRQAHIDTAQLTIYQPTDGIYNVFRIAKS